MSINTNREIKCPKCSNLCELTLWQSITVSDSGDLKDDLLKGKVNIFRCASCGTVALVPVPLLYHDEDKQLMISFSPCEDSDRLRLFSEVKETSRQSGELSEFSGYNLRFVTQYNELLEKILIFDNGLSDKAIEVLKLLVLMQDSDKMNDRVCMFGKIEGEQIEFMVQDKKEGQIYTSRVPVDTYNTVLKSLKDSGVKEYSFDWEIVDAEYAAKLLQGSNNNL